MRIEAHVQIMPTRVRTALLPRHGAVRLDYGRTFAWSTGLGLPRTWRTATDRVLGAARKSLDSQKNLPVAERFENMLRLAREQLVHDNEMLLERQPADATLHAMYFDDEALHVVSCGAARVYVFHGRSPKRLTTKHEPRDGLLHAEPTVSTQPVFAGDIVLAGSTTAFSTQAVARMTSVLESDPNTPAAVLANVLTEPTNDGPGAVALVLRFLG